MERLQVIEEAVVRLVEFKTATSGQSKDGVAHAPVRALVVNELFILVDKVLVGFFVRHLTEVNLTLDEVGALLLVEVKAEHNLESNVNDYGREGHQQGQDREDRGTVNKTKNPLCDNSEELEWSQRYNNASQSVLGTSGRHLAVTQVGLLFHKTEQADYRKDQASDQEREP